ncbi:MAG TPA: glycosyltransferase family 4 protein [Candidatus Sulfotelmatobacter sp.]|nr:glycosyltransferase family 4 protein [Candidatus Sulfotelmatobacter sp.]
MRLLLLCHEYPPAGGGAGWATHQIAWHLGARGHAVTLLTARHARRPQPPPDLPYRLVEVGWAQRSTSGGSAGAWLDFMQAGSRGALALARAARPDAALAFLTLPAGVAAAVLSLRRGVPFVVSLRGGDVPGFFPQEYRRYHLATAWAIRAIWRRAAALAANSAGLRALALRAGARAVETIPNGVDLDLFRPRAEGPPPDPVTVLSVGRFAPQKNNAGLLRAAAGAARKVSRPFRLELVGDGPERGSLAALAGALGLADRVAFLPWQPREALLARYQGAHLLALASYEEGMPNVVLEAMACGLPILGTRIGGTEELVSDGDNGLLVPPGDEAALAGALAALVEDDGLRARMGARSLGRARAHGWDGVAGAYLGLLQAAAGGPA